MSYFEIKDLQKRYTKGGPLVVDHMDMSIDKGEFIVFLGPSGCGKTTTLRMIAGLEEVSGGDILVDGHSVLALSPREREVSMIFQSYAVWPHMTVYQNIAYPLKLQKIHKNEIDSRVKEAAEITQISGLLDRYPSQLSGGQRQRIAVSRAIVINPKLFLMDEPLSNLDAKLRVSMRTDLREIHNKMGATSIFVTHDQSEAMSLADRIFIMNRGKIEQVGTPMEVYQQSATKFVAGFIGTPPTNFFQVTITRTQDGWYAMNQDVHLRIPERYQQALLPYEEKIVDLGLRPEFINPYSGTSEIPFSKAKVNFVEQQGSHAILITTIEKSIVKIEINDFFNVKPGAILSLTVKKDMMGFFDQTTGKRII